MIDFIPLESYYPLYINLSLFIVLFTLMHTRVVSISDSKNLLFINLSGLFLLGFLILYIGLRPINRIFGDTVNYNFSFQQYRMGAPIGKVADYGWHVFMKFMASFTSIHVFFAVMSFLYIIPMYAVCKFYLGKYWYYGFLMFVVSFSFWAYGTNGVRNGVACSLFLWGLKFRDRKLIMLLLFIWAALFHKTVLLPVFAYTITYIYNNPKTYLKFWLACIPLSLIAGGLWIQLFSGLGFADERAVAYLSSEALQGTSDTVGFRWDFLFYSAFPVFAGWYFVVKKKFKDVLYNQLLNTYLICNAFWILVMQANYSNRFAYLSWFMMAIVIIYPLLKQTFFKKQHTLIGNIVLFYFSFTYLMFYIYYNAYI